MGSSLTLARAGARNEEMVRSQRRAIWPLYPQKGLGCQGRSEIALKAMTSRIGYQPLPVV
jgi:hypothetical protein